MNICTILTADWVDAHGVRWVRYMKKNNPDCNLFLYYLGEDMDRDFPGFSANFAEVRRVPLEGRPQFNRIRMSATADFGVDEILYCDADADCLATLDQIPTIVEGASLAFVESPAKHQDWVDMCKENEWDSWEANNGLLYMTEDWGERYDEAVEAVKDKANPRISGTIAFNHMLRNHDGWARLPYPYGCIWWDSTHFRGAKIIQYCNDQGQAKRVAMEQEWRNAQIIKPSAKSEEEA